jgi:hypothetical protein
MGTFGLFSSLANQPACTIILVAINSCIVLIVQMAYLKRKEHVSGALDGKNTGYV